MLRLLEFFDFEEVGDNDNDDADADEVERGDLQTQARRGYVRF